MKKIDKERVERAARLYASNRDAGLALGIAPGSFGRLCRRFGIPTPQHRKRQYHQTVRRFYTDPEA